MTEYTAPTDDELKGRKVLVMGLGLFHGGAAVVRFLANSGARIHVTDLRTEAELQPTLEGLAGVEFARTFGGHETADFTAADLIVVNPAVPADSPFLAAASKAGVPLTSEIGLFLSRLPSRLALVTGSKGKSTTATLLHDMAKRGGLDVVLGGNIGTSLLDRVEELRADQLVVYEISSFQLEQIKELDRRPEVVAITNIFPVHLDRHGDFEVYAELKMSAMEGAECAVLNFADDRLRAFGARGDADEVWFSLQPAPPADYFAKAGAVFTSDGETVIEAGALQIPGAHNLENFMAALACAERLGVSREAAVAAARAFPGVEHRLEFVGERRGARLYNDSIATTPRSTMAALAALDGAVVLLAGGRDSGVDLEPLAAKIAERARSVVTFGEAGERVARAVRSHAPDVAVVECADLPAAVRAALGDAREGDTIVLSPAFPSYDQFKNFRERGETFRTLAMASS